MDRQAVAPLRRPPVTADLIEQAVFTSIRSPMARGYRIVAASRGITDDEKREIVQRAPSHGNLEQEGPEAEALAGFLLRSGRYCLLQARHAGRESSNRGGLRVHTHVVMLSRELFLREFAGNPLRLAIFAAPALEESVQRVEGPLLAALAPPETPEWGEPGATECSANSISAPGAVLGLASALLNREAVLVINASAAAAVLQDVFAVTPAGLRPEIGFAFGLKPSVQRSLPLLFHDAEPRGLEGFLRDQGHRLVDWSGEAAQRIASDPYAPWLDFAQRRWEQGRLGEVRALCDRLEEEIAPEALALDAALAVDLEALEEVDAAGLEQLRTKWSTATATGPVSRALLVSVRERIEARLAAITPEVEADAQSS